METSKLFSPYKIGPVEIKNRIVMPAIGTSFATSSGEASDEIIRYYEERAKGGAGLIVTEITRIDNEYGVGTSNQLAATDAYQIPRLEKLVKAVHRYDTKIFFQLHHPGRQTYGHLIGGKQIVAPSAVMSKAVGEMPRALETEEVEALVKAFVKGAKLTQIAGADGVELHAAHGYLIGQFLSPLTNERTDQYGGSLENRLRFLTEIVLGIKHVCGPAFPISVRISADEFVAGGLQLEEAVQISQMLEQLGVDAINVSSGTYESATTIIEPISYPEGWKRHLAKAIRAAVEIPVIACNVIRTPAFAEQLLVEDDIDFVAVGRAQLADPAWANKARANKADEITPCISCLFCIEELGSGKRLKCAVNPKVGREADFDELVKDGNDRVVAIVGGGPAGMQSAITLADRGFKPVLFEARDVLGGSVYIGSKPPHKEKLTGYLAYLEREMQRRDVDIRLNTEATVDVVQALDPYAVFVAPGATPFIPEIPGIDGDNVCTIEDILSGRVVLADEKVVIVGSGLTGLETAEYLADTNTVTVIEMQDEIAKGAYKPNVIDVVMRLQKQAVELIPNLQLQAITEAGVNVLATETNEATHLEADRVVLSLGMRAKQDIVETFKAHFTNVSVLGDAREPARIPQAIETGMEKAYIL